MKICSIAWRSGYTLALLVILSLVGGTALAQDVERGGPVEPTPEHPGEPVMAPEVDRLAAPPTVAAPTQADNGAQAYWLHCQPCHGDVGQGLTEEWRAQYPPEDQNCWESGCHGERPYENGFTLPFTVPAVVGDGTLWKFETAGALYRYTQVAMPFWKPGSLTEDDYLAITAHLAREQGTWDGTVLTPDNVDDVLLLAGLQAQTNPEAASSTASVAATPVVTTPETNSGINNFRASSWLWGGLALGILALAGGIFIWQRLNH